MQRCSQRASWECPPTNSPRASFFSRKRSFWGVGNSHRKHPKMTQSSDPWMIPTHFHSIFALLLLVKPSSCPPRPSLAPIRWWCSHRDGQAQGGPYTRPGNAVYTAGFMGINSNLRDHQTQGKWLFLSQKAAEILQSAKFLSFLHQ